MPYKSTWKGTGLYREFTGKVTGGEVLSAVLTAHGDARFNDLSYIMNDFTGMVDFEITELDIKNIAITDHVASKRNSQIKVANVATNEAFLQWVDLYLDKMQSAPYVYEVFSNREEANDWLTESTCAID